MQNTETDPGRPKEATATPERVIAPERPTRRLDRADIAAIIQRTPSDRYTLLSFLPDPVNGRMRRRRGVIADADGHEVLAAIERERMVLHLHDIDDVLRPFDITLPATPIGPQPRHRLRHGLLLASPGLAFGLDASPGEGAVRLLAGTVRLAPAGETGGGRSVTYGPGAVLARHPGVATAIEVGETMLVAATVGAVRRDGLGALLRRARRMVAALGAGRSPFRDEEAAIDFRLTRARPGPRGLT